MTNVRDELLRQMADGLNLLVRRTATAETEHTSLTMIGRIARAAEALRLEGEAQSVMETVLRVEEATDEYGPEEKHSRLISLSFGGVTLHLQFEDDPHATVARAQIGQVWRIIDRVVK